MKSVSTTISRRWFLGTAAAISAAYGMGLAALAGCKSHLTVDAGPSQHPEQAKAANAGPPPPDMNKHRAFLALWLLATTNQNVLSNNCTIDFPGVANALGQHLSAADVSTVISIVRNNRGYFSVIAAAFQPLDPNNAVATANCSNFASVAANLNDTSALLDKHRALLTSWLLVTTNNTWLNDSCSIDYGGIAHVLGGNVAGSDVSKIFRTAKTHLGQFSHVGSALFNSDPDLKRISGYDNPFYSGKQCPPTMSQVVIDLMNPNASGSFHEPRGCAGDQVK